MSLADLLLEHPFADDEPLLHTVDVSVTAGEARARARELAQVLGEGSEAGEVGSFPALHPGQGVAVMLPNGPELVCTMMAVWLAGGVFVPVNPRLPEAEVRAVLAETRPALFVTESAIEPVGPAEGGGPVTHPPDTAFVVWTSGTSGRPKPILHTHTAYLELLDRVLGPLRAGSRDATRAPSPNLIPVSMALNAGIYNALFGLRAGAALVIMDRFEPEAFAELVRRFQIRSTVLPPAAMSMLAEAGGTDPGALGDLAPLRYVRSITAPLSPLQAQRFVARFPGVFVLNGYGQAEMGEVIGWTAADAKAHPEKVGAVGRPHPGVEIRLSPDAHLLVRPPNAALGIDDRRDADGFIDTGDLARIDDDGFVWIEGRAGDVINRGGNKVHPEAVEEVLRLMPGVADAAVVGMPDDRLGEVPVVFVVGVPSRARPDDSELTAHCREHLVPYKVPVAFHWIDELPRSEIGKVLRRDLAEQAVAIASS